MAEGKRIYEIKINGLTESYEGVKSLREALDTLTDTVVNVTKQEEKSTASKKESKSATDALSKAQEKLNNWDKEYQTELAKTNAELSNNKKEINATIKVQQAQEVVDAKQLDTYAQKQQYLSALNTLIRNHSTATEEDRNAIDRMVQESAALQAELKATDEQMKIYVRNVGNYPGAAQMVVESHKSLKQELKELKTAMAEMMASGVSKTDEAYLKLAERAGQLKDAMADANQDITNFASDTRGLTNAINLASSAVNAYQLYNSVMSLVGDENEDAAKSMQKMMSVMTLLNSLQQVQNSLLENGSATARLYSKAVELVQAALGIKKAATEADIATTEASTIAEETNTAAQTANAVANEANAASTGTATAAETANTGAVTANTTATQANTVATNSMSVAQKAGAVASNILSVALRAIPLMAVIGLVMTLITQWESIWNWFRKTFPVLDTLSNKFNKFGGFMKTVKAIAKGLGEGIINWLVNPFKTLGNVIGKILKGDFEGAAKAAIDGVKQQFKGFSDSINKELNNAAISATEERVKKQKKKEHELTEYQLQELTARNGNEAKYSKEGIALQQKEFAQRKALAKGNAEELKKIHLEELSFQRECQEQQTKAAEKGAKARTAAAKSAAAEAKKNAEAAKKEAEELEKKIDELLKKAKKAVEESEKTVEESEKKTAKQADEQHKKNIERYLKYAQLYAADMLKMTDYATKTSEKADEVRGIILDAAESGTESEVALLKGYLKELEFEMNYFSTQVVKDGDKITEAYNAIDYFVAERHQYAVDQIARGAQKVKEQYQSQIDTIQASINEMEAQLANANAKQAAELKAQIKESKQQIKELKQAAKAELGQYGIDGLEIHIPVEIDFKNVSKRYGDLVNKLKAENKTVGFSLTQIVDASVGVRGALREIYNNAKEKGPEALVETFSQFAEVLGMAKGETEDELDVFGEFVNLVKTGKPFETIEEELNSFVNQGTLDLSKFGVYTLDAMDNLKKVTDEHKKAIDDVFKSVVSEQDKVISFSEKTIRQFQDATRDIKFEPVTDNSKFFETHLIKIKETKERYAKLKTAYKEYLETIKVGSETMQKYEEAWQIKLDATKRNVENIKQLYGESSEEYKNAVRDYILLTKEKEKADAAYLMEREKVAEKIDEIEKKENDIPKDGLDALGERIKEIYDIFNNNVMQPIQDGLGALFDFQLEEMKEALDEIEKLYDKAVEAREESAERMKQINEELRNDEGQNKEALQQRLAEEEVLLVQREEAERALQKEKEKKEKEIKKKEAQMRILELTQKLAEGITNTALGITAALKYGPILGPIFAAIIGAMGAVQTAVIAKQIDKAKSQMEHGGKVGEKGISRSHKQGGHRIEDTNIEVEGGEWVINKKSSQKYDTVLRAINEDNVNLVNKQIEIIKEKRVTRENVIRKFASGGQINTLAATNAVKDNNQIEAITDLIRQIDFQPTVAVTDINKVNKNLVRVQQYAGKSA